MFNIFKIIQKKFTAVYCINCEYCSEGVDSNVSGTICKAVKIKKKIEPAYLKHPPTNGITTIKYHNCVKIRGNRWFCFKYKEIKNETK